MRAAFRRSSRPRPAAFLPCALLASAFCVAPAFPQVPLLPDGPGTGVNIIGSDFAVLEAGEPRQDLPCAVTPDKPELGFDLRFHAGYEVTVPLRELSGSGDALTILFRVTSESGHRPASYFFQHVRVPSIDADASGDAALQGAFDLGPGKYHVDWLMRDRSEHVCSSYWDSEAVLQPKDGDIALQAPPGAILPADSEQFREEPPVHRSAADPLRVKVLINFAPQNSLSAVIQPVDASALVSILRSISRQPRFGKFSIVAFNMQEQRVLYRQQDAMRIDFPALGAALRSVKLGTVRLAQLSGRHGDTAFLADLIRNEAGAGDRPDALIFAGPKVMLDAQVPQDAIQEFAEPGVPVFYMNYNRNPQAIPWRDAIGRAVRLMKGYEFTISRPRDLWRAVGEMVARIVKSRNGRPVAAISTY